MTEELSYFEVTSFLAEIEADYADVKNPTERTAKLVARLQEQWPFLTAEQALAYVRTFSQPG